MPLIFKTSTPHERIELGGARVCASRRSAKGGVERWSGRFWALGTFMGRPFPGWRWPPQVSLEGSAGEHIPPGFLLRREEFEDTCHFLLHQLPGTHRLDEVP